MRTETPERREWTILHKTQGGTVSYIRDLTLAEARQIYDRLDPEYGRHVVADASGGASWISYPYDSRTVLREVFGPPDWDRTEIKTWSHWPKMVYPPFPAKETDQ